MTLSADGRWLLVISHNGTGVFDCQTMKRVARDYSDYGEFDEATDTVDGIRPFGEGRVPIFGLRGAIHTRNNLPTRTEDGWELEWEDEEAEYLGRPDTPVYLRSHNRPPARRYLIGKFEPIYAIGFSPNGSTLVVAESHTITVFTRSHD